jgi:hypothetical protein
METGNLDNELIAAEREQPHDHLWPYLPRRWQ